PLQRWAERWGCAPTHPHCFRDALGRARARPYRRIRSRNSFGNGPSISTDFIRDFAPALSWIFARGTPVNSDRYSISAALALPSTAGALIFSRISSSVHETTSFFGAFGVTRTFSRISIIATYKGSYGYNLRMRWSFKIARIAG